MAARSFFRIVIYLLFAIVLIASIAFAAVKYWVLPSIHLWKEPITKVLSQAVGAPVKVGHIQARWQGLSPELEFEDVAVFNSRDHKVLSIPHAVGRLKLSSIWALSPHFSRLEVTGLALLVSRDQEGTIDLFSRQKAQRNDEPTEVSELKAGIYRWLAQQGRLQIRDSHVVWQDLSTAKPPLALLIEDLSLLQHQGHLQVSGVLSSLRHAHTQLRFSSEWQLPNEEKPRAPLAQGHVQLQLKQLQPSAWRRWVDMPSFLYQGTINAQLFLDIKDEQLDYAEGSISIERPFWADGRELLSIEPQPFFQARAAQFHFEFDQQALRTLTSLSAEDPMPLSIPGAHWRAQLDDLNVHVPNEFEQPLYFKQIKLDAYSKAFNDSSPQSQSVFTSTPSLTKMESAGLDAAADAFWHINQLHIDTGAGVLQLQGDLRLHAADLWLSEVDLEGVGQSIALANIYKFFPNSLDPDLRDWLQQGLTAGEIEQLRFEWQGLLDDFEYYQERDTGQFQLQAQIRGATIDYYPPIEQEAGWPAVTGLNGQLYWKNDYMRIETENQPSLRLSPDHDALIQQVSAQITDLYQRADLTVHAQAQAAADDFFLLWPHSNLAQVLEDTVQVEHLSGAGWRIDLRLDLPLGVPEAEMERLTQVKGVVHIEEPSVVALWPELPPFSQVQGHFGFSEIGVHEVDVHAQWLGGPLSIHGGLGGSDAQLQIKAHPSIERLQSFYEHPALRSIDGDFELEALLSLNADEHLSIAVQSDLYGLAVDLPAPLQKTKAESRWPLQLEWLFIDDAANKNQIKVAIQERLYGQAIFDFEQHQVESALILSAWPEEGGRSADKGQLIVDIQYPFLDVDAWWNWFEHIDSQDGPSWQWPKQSQIRMQADEAYVLGFGLEYFTYTHQLVESGLWRADVSSDQIAGTLFWRQQPNRQHPVGHIEAHFHRFDVLADFTPQVGVQTPKGKHVITQGDLSQSPIPSTKITPEQPKAEPIYAPLLAELPSVTLKVDEFNVGGYLLGTLDLEASGVSQGLGWNIDHFSLKVDEVMQAQGSGRWLIWGANPGLELRLDSDFKNLGAYAEHLGLSGYIEGGQGQLEADFYWPYLPWQSDLDDLQGQFSIEFEQGRLQPIQSRSAKLLEFLSLQSLSRIARLDFDIGSLLKEGFPFHLIEGGAQFKNGWVQTEDYKVISPVGSLFFKGRTHLQDYQIDAEAVVIPELDVSGAALAAGMVVNPIVGVGALVAQWLLKHPLSQAMSVRYRITGDWDDFNVEEIEVTRGQDQVTPHVDK